MAKKLKLNIPLLKKIKKHILEEPKRYHQEEVVAFGAPGEKISWSDYKYPACGTVACLGGWGYILGTAPSKNDPFDSQSVLDKAQKLLGLDNSQACVLFDGEGESWPSKFSKRFAKVKTPVGQAKVAADLLDEVVATKGQNLTDAYLASQTDNEGVFEEWENMP